MEQAIISADSHVIEIPDLWEKGLPSSLRDRAPKAYFDEGRDAWMFGSADVVPQAWAGCSWPASGRNRWRSSAGGLLGSAARWLGPGGTHQGHGPGRRVG